jgi:hypothetical protein
MLSPERSSKFSKLQQGFPTSEVWRDPVADDGQDHELMVRGPYTERERQRLAIVSEILLDLMSQGLKRRLDTVPERIRRSDWEDDPGSVKDAPECRTLDGREWLPRLDHPLNKGLLHSQLVQLDVELGSGESKRQLAKFPPLIKIEDVLLRDIISVDRVHNTEFRLHVKPTNIVLMFETAKVESGPGQLADTKPDDFDRRGNNSKARIRGEDDRRYQVSRPRQFLSLSSHQTHLEV